MIEEDQKLTQLKEHFAQLPVPNDIDRFIHKGIHRAVQKKKKISMLKWVNSAVVMLLVIVVSFNVVPFISNFNSAEKSQQTTIELTGVNPYMQEDLQLSQSQFNVTITMDKIRLDYATADIFFTVEQEKDVDYDVSSSFIKNEQGEIIAYGIEDYSRQVKMNMVENAVISDKLAIELTITLRDKNNLQLQYAFPIEINTEQVPKPAIYPLEKEMEIIDQIMYAHSITVHPTEIHLQLSFDENNSKHIFGFEDYRLETADGHRFYQVESDHHAPIVDNDSMLTVRFAANGLHDLDPINSEVSDLFFTGSKLRAMDKTKMNIQIDVDNEQWLNSYDFEQRFSFIGIKQADENKSLTFMLKKSEYDSQTYYSIFSPHFTDSKGTSYKAVASKMSSWEKVNDSYVARYQFTIPDASYSSPISLDIVSYPFTINKYININLLK
ncbi:DUF4179 domain-containing protein [Longirhabdus pacifica]|uniref:DUF4179 domain-containing protein n=1 Tax=Longirhabdus pacifica TaxID=2305227 RepID=UPI001008A275|nr:DUF4179 domain-containing protein [Longirhabdus pacifica]